MHRDCGLRWANMIILLIGIFPSGGVLALTRVSRLSGDVPLEWADCI